MRVITCDRCKKPAKKFQDPTEEAASWQPLELRTFVSGLLPSDAPRHVSTTDLCGECSYLLHRFLEPIEK